ncbi:hypothetical protein HpHNI37_15320 [Helicobacter pylori]
MADELQNLGFLKSLIQKREVLLRKKKFYNDKVIKERFLIMENKEKKQIG